MIAFIKDLPRLTGELARYAKYRRKIWRELESRNKSITAIECVGLVEGLRRAHAYRFPGEPLPVAFDVTTRINADCENLELLYLAQLCRVIRPETIFEIGTYEGRSANMMALNTSAACRIYTLDLPPERAGESRFAIASDDKKWLLKEAVELGGRLGGLPDPRDNERIVQLLGDSAVFDFEAYRGQIDLVFIDGAHSYDYVMSDVNNALALVAERGLILMHDFITHDDVTLAATALRKKYEIIHIWEMAYVLLFPRNLEQS